MLKSPQLSIGGIIDTPGSSLQYKTGTWRVFYPSFIETKCINCFLCVRNCPENCIKIKNGKREKANLDYCKGCGICAEICPVKAISMKKYVQ